MARILESNLTDIGDKATLALDPAKVDPVYLVDGKLPKIEAERIAYSRAGRWYRIDKLDMRVKPFAACKDDVALIRDIVQESLEPIEPIRIERER